MVNFFGTIISTTGDHRINFNTLETLDFLDKSGHGLILDNYPSHFFLAFDITSLQEASHDFIHPELKNFSFLDQPTFDKALAANVEALFLGGKQRSQLSPSPPIDNDEIPCLLGKCIHLKYF